MTLKEFLHLLENTPREWRLTSIGSIRIGYLDGVGVCPINCVAPIIFYRTGPFMRAAETLGLPHMLAKQIGWAADNKNIPYGHAAFELRKKLLTACGLTE
jgi:hypothetical protein